MSEKLLLKSELPPKISVYRDASEIPEAVGELLQARLYLPTGSAFDLFRSVVVKPDEYVGKLRKDHFYSINAIAIAYVCGKPIAWAAAVYYGPHSRVKCEIWRYTKKVLSGSGDLHFFG